MRIEHVFYWIRSHTYRRNHMLDLRQPHTNTDDDYRWGWIDDSYQILLANFTILVNYYNNLESCKFKYNATPSGIEEFRKYAETQTFEDEKRALNNQLHHLEEVGALYRYWTVDRKTKLREKNRLLKDWAECKRRSKEKDVLWNKLNEYEAEIDQEEDEMLARLMKIRRGMWI